MQQDNKLTITNFVAAINELGVEENGLVELRVNQCLILQANDIAVISISVNVVVIPCTNSEMPPGYEEEIDATVYFPWSVKVKSKRLDFDGRYDCIGERRERAAQESKHSTCFDYVDETIEQAGKFGVSIFVEPAGKIIKWGDSLESVIGWWMMVFISQPPDIDYAVAGWHLWELAEAGDLPDDARAVWAGMKIGRTWFVDESIKISGDGLSPEAAFKTRSEAIAAITAGDTVKVD